VHDPDDLRVNGYDAPGGPTRSQLRKSACAIAARLPLAGVTVTAYDPALDPQGAVPMAAADLLSDLINAVEHRNA